MMTAVAFRCCLVSWLVTVVVGFVFRDDSIQPRSSSIALHLSRKDAIRTLFGTFLIGGGSMLNQPSIVTAANDESSKIPTIAACSKPVQGTPPNCVSTASVKQVDLYMAPWTWKDNTKITGDEIAARLKGIINTDQTLFLEEQINDRYFRVKASRNFCFDQIEFFINDIDKVITFRSKQIDGPDSISDFGANRKRLDDIRKRIKVVSIMGSDFSSADSGPREGTIDQLKAFWGFQSGGGYESILLDEDDDY